MMSDTQMHAVSAGGEGQRACAKSDIQIFKL
jgi:hypothetical protein